MYTDDPVRDAGQRDADDLAEEKKRPVCDICGDPIFDDVAYQINGLIICETCIDEARVYLD